MRYQGPSVPLRGRSGPDALSSAACPAHTASLPRVARSLCPTGQEVRDAYEGQVLALAAQSVTPSFRCRRGVGGPRVPRAGGTRRVPLRIRGLRSAGPRRAAGRTGTGRRDNDRGRLHARELRAAGRGHRPRPGPGRSGRRRDRVRLRSGHAACRRPARRTRLEPSRVPVARSGRRSRCDRRSGHRATGATAAVPHAVAGEVPRGGRAPAGPARRGGRAPRGRSRDAQLVVLGHGPRHSPTDPRIGPVTQAVLHHAHAPVAVVPHD
ncbi:universal stress protein [Streptomyces sp. NPDC020707]|uniref:universal stress protein n=1 Tax=Streptomyces sp. NPDC020707 TaxID=3365084 RepID=UPI00378C4E8D